MIPPPPTGNRLLAAISRFISQLQRTTKYLELQKPIVARGDDDPNVQFLYQTVILMVHTFMEEYFRHLVFLGTYWQPELAREYLIKRVPGERLNLEEMAAVQLARRARKEVSFRTDAARLRGILGALGMASPFGDTTTEPFCLDLITVRNIITHQGGDPDESNVPTLRSKNVVVAVETPLGGPFYRLTIRTPFFEEALSAIGKAVVMMETHLNNDPRYTTDPDTLPDG